MKETKDRDIDIVRPSSHCEIDDAMKIVNFPRDESEGDNDQVLKSSSRDNDQKIIQNDHNQQAQKEIEDIIKVNTINPAENKHRGLYEGLKQIEGVDS